MNSKTEPLVLERMKQVIRDLIVIDPLISLRRIQKALDDKGLHCGLEYVGKVRKKVHGEAVIQVDMTKVTEAIAEVSESYRVKKQQLQKIIFASPEYAEPRTPVPTYKDKLAAIRLDAQLELALFTTKVSVGLFKPNMEEFRKWQREKPVKIPDDIKAKMILAFQNHGLIPGGVKHEKFVYVPDDDEKLSEEQAFPVEPEPMEPEKPRDGEPDDDGFITTTTPDGATIRRGPFA